MEVLGAIASSIAIAQALAAGPKIANLIREIPEIQDNLKDLRSELDLLSSIVEQAKRLPQLPTSNSDSSQSSEETLMFKAAARVNGIVDELNQVLQSCVHESDELQDKQFKAKKRKWLLQSRKIEKLQRSAHYASTHLHSAIFCHLSLLTCNRITNEAENQVEMRQLFKDFMSMSSKRLATTEHHASQALLPLPAGNRATEQDPGFVELNASQNLEMRHIFGLESNDNLNQISTQRESRICLESVVPLSQQSCSLRCQCRCHFHDRCYASWNWIQPLLGSWIVECDNIPYHRRPKCTDRTCTSQDLVRIRMQYQVPRWFTSGLHYFRISYSSLEGITCSLRPARTISTEDSIWLYLEAPLDVAYQRITEGPRFYPDDHDTSECSLIEYAVEQQLFSGIEVLLTLWEHILQEQGFPRILLYKANEILLYSGGLSDHETYLLQKVKSLVYDMPGWATTKIHQSLSERSELQKALREQPWAIDLLDDMGDTPLHTACKLDLSEAVEQLVAAGADINRKGCRGWTPLMTASYYSSLHCAKILIQGGCLIDQKSTTGSTALHHATWESSQEMISLLLAAGASTISRDQWNNTPLMYLAQDSDADYETMQQIIELLTLTKPHVIEAASENGMTPILTALAVNRLSTLRALRNAGGSFLAVTSFSHNLLHIASKYATPETLYYLISQEISGIDTELQDRDADTPWDEFKRWVYSVSIQGRPSRVRQQAFAKLYQGIRDRNLQHDIIHLEQVLEGLQKQNVVEARQHIAILIKQKEEWKKTCLVDWYRAVDKRIQHFEWALASQDLEEYLEELKAELKTSVWDIPSEYDHMWKKTEKAELISTSTQVYPNDNNTRHLKQLISEAQSDRINSRSEAYGDGDVMAKLCR